MHNLKIKSDGLSKAVGDAVSEIFPLKVIVKKVNSIDGWTVRKIFINDIEVPRDCIEFIDETK